MARYYFDHRDNDRFFPDDEGTELPDLAAARSDAATTLAEIAKDVIPGSEQRTLTIEVRDDNGPIFATRLVFEVVRMRGEPDQYGRDQRKPATRQFQPDPLPEITAD
jgi:hypothetical protein